jgi:hypothetical protein
MKIKIVHHRGTEVTEKREVWEERGRRIHHRGTALFSTKKTYHAEPRRARRKSRGFNKETRERGQGVSK